MGLACAAHCLPLCGGGAPGAPKKGTPSEDRANRGAAVADGGSSCSAEVSNSRPGRTLPGIRGVRSRVEERFGRLRTCTRVHLHPKAVEDDYEVTKEVLGTGGNGDVLLAGGRGAKAAQTYAVKALLRRPDLGDVSGQQQETFEGEVEALLSIDHPHIVRLLDVYIAPDSVKLVMERMMGGDLLDALFQVKVFTEGEAAEAAHQMLLAVNYLHGFGIVHRDLKLDNFMYEDKEKRHLKLIDFGYSKIVDHLGAKMSMKCGSLPFCAPEVLRMSYDSQCDLWSLGVVMFTLLSGYLPFSGKPGTTTRAILRGSYKMRPERWSRVSEDGRRFVASLLEVDPARRLTAQQALEQPWVLAGREVGRRLAAQCRRGKGLGGISDVASALRKYGKASKFRRACLSLMVWSLTSEERLQVQEDFFEMDRSRDGLIELSDLREVLEKKAAIADDEVSRIFEALDTNSDERVNYADFLAAMLTTRISVHNGHIKQTFDRFDLDRSGYITVDELQETLGDTFEGQEVEMVVKDMDRNGDGSIDLFEFMEFFERCGDGALPLLHA